MIDEQLVKPGINDRPAGAGHARHAPHQFVWKIQAHAYEDPRHGEGQTISHLHSWPS